MERERQRWMDEESRNKAQEEENYRRQEEKMRRERAALQQLHYAEIETLKQQHAEHIHHLKVAGLVEIQFKKKMLTTFYEISPIFPCKFQKY